MFHSTILCADEMLIVRESYALRCWDETHVQA